MQDFRGCYKSQNPHNNFQNSIPTHGLDMLFTGCEQQYLIENSNLITICRLIQDEKNKDWLQENWLKSFMFQYWDNEKQLNIMKNRG